MDGLNLLAEGFSWILGRIIFIGALIPFFMYLVEKLKKSIHIFQLNQYGFLRYFKWLKRNFKEVFLTFELVLLLFIRTFYVRDFSEIFYLCLILIFGVYLFLFKTWKKTFEKKPLVYTPKIKRLITTISLLIIVAIFLSIRFGDDLTFFLTIISISYLSYLIVILGTIINLPLEKSINFYYINDAKRKIRSLTRLEVVGITGSYGKTSTKNFLNEILLTKYNSLATPRSINTKLGLTITIRKELSALHDIFIAEMGAYKPGEIKELTRFVKPKYGILTKIGPAHLEYFGSIKNIQKTKFELIEALPEDGIAVLNMDDELQTSYKLKNKCKVLWYSMNNKNADTYATNVVYSHEGMSFDVYFKGEKKPLKIQTKLLGRHNVYNNLASLTLARALGINNDNLIKGAKNIKPVPHRLELKIKNDIIYIDDSFNSNPEGAKAALEVLSLMPGKKVIITPGMIELGPEEEKLNKELGYEISKVCDYAILVGKKQTKPIYEGLIEVGYDKKKIYVTNDLRDAFNHLENIKDNKTYVLIENDLPDNYNE